MYRSVIIGSFAIGSAAVLMAFAPTPSGAPQPADSMQPAIDSGADAGTYDVAAAAAFAGWRVTVTGGPFAGSYELSSWTPCSKDNPAKGMLAMGYDRGVDSAFAKEKAPIRKALNDPKSLNWAQLYADAKTGTGKVTLYFGKLTSEDGPSAKRGTRYEVETRSGKKAKGSGKFTVKPSGDGAEIAFEGASAQGVKLAVHVTCEQFF